ncbi:hypothetical protein B0H13DRAFT_1879355 [Mycena leptocephala]|nr:hypothetical protein B0H13DRAFT_1879355 [Mycena leptocephala]
MYSGRGCTLRERRQSAVDGRLSAARGADVVARVDPVQLRQRNVEDNGQERCAPNEGGCKDEVQSSRGRHEISTLQRIETVRTERGGCAGLDSIDEANCFGHACLRDLRKEDDQKGLLKKAGSGRASQTGAVQRNHVTRANVMVLGTPLWAPSSSRSRPKEQCHTRDRLPQRNRMQLGDKDASQALETAVLARNQTAPSSVICTDVF